MLRARGAEYLKAWDANVNAAAEDAAYIFSIHITTESDILFSRY